MNNNLFSDSSILLSLHKGKEIKSKIVNLFNQVHYKVTASYCIVEYLNMIMDKTEYYIGKIKKFGSIEKAREFINNALAPQKNNDKLWFFNLLNENYGKNDKECTERAIYSLEFLRLTCLSHIKKYFNIIINEINCYAYLNNYMVINNVNAIWITPKCNANDIKCNLNHFFKKNIDIFIKIKEAIDKLSIDEKTIELKEFSEVINKALIDSNSICDYKTGCKKLADVIITVESKSILNFFTQNYKESLILCKDLKQVLYVLSNNFEKNIDIHNFSDNKSINFYKDCELKK